MTRRNRPPEIRSGGRKSCAFQSTVIAAALPAYQRFIQATVAPLLFAVVVGIITSLMSPGDEVITADWVGLAISFIALPFWAGMRARRSSLSLGCAAVAGALVVVGTVVSIGITEAIEPSEAGPAWDQVLSGLLLFVPISAIAGLLGGAAARTRTDGAA